MSVKIEEIVPGMGLGEVKFGFTREQVKELLGEPDESEVFSHSETGENLTDAWHYDEWEASFSFDEEEDWKLTNIAVSAPEFQLKGKSLIGLNQERVLAELEAFNFGPQEEEDWSDEENPNNVLISFPEMSLNLWFDQGALSEIQWGTLWEDENTPVWPQ